MAKRLPLRVVLKLNGIHRKFFTLIVAKDNSVFIHQNRPHGQGWRIPHARPGDVPKTTILNFTNFVEPPFELQKMSIHQSGYIHMTDKAGNRYKDGTRGPSFAEMTFPYPICVLVPCDPVQLPIYERDRSHVAAFEIPGNLAPFYMTISLISAAAPPPAVAAPLLSIQPVNFLFEGHQIGIALSLWPVKTKDPGETPPWPSFPFLLVRTAA